MKARANFRELICFADYVSGGELFTHLYQRERFTVDQVRIYIGEIILALEHLHKVCFSFVFCTLFVVWYSLRLLFSLSDNCYLQFQQVLLAFFDLLSAKNITW